MLIIHIVAGGPVACLPDLIQYQEEGVFWVGVDNGMMTLLECGITPDHAIGDFDSIDPEILEELKEMLPSMTIAPREKDDTDTALAVKWALSQKPNKIRLFGSTGGRLDHLMGNVYLLLEGKEIPIEMVDNQNIASAYYPGTQTVSCDETYKYISFLPLSTVVEQLTLDSFKYPLVKHNLWLGSTICVSNELIQDSGTFSFAKGILMMVRSKD